VISASEEPGKKLSKGEKIDLVVSKGVAPIPVPNVEGLTFDAAYATLAKRGFRVGKDEVFDDDVPKGKVVSQYPKSTESKPANSLIIVRVSKGEEKKEDSKDDKKDEKKDDKSDDDKKDSDKDKKHGAQTAHCPKAPRVARRRLVWFEGGCWLRTTRLCRIRRPAAPHSSAVPPAS